MKHSPRLCLPLLQRGVLAASLALAFSLTPLPAADWPQWRGPQRNGLSPETGLLRQWPTGGPRLLWQVKDLGQGYAAPAVAGERLYVLSNEGLEDEFVQAHAVADGRRLWRTRLGKVGNPNQQPCFPAARSTPTVDGTLLFALSSDGDLACVETATGKIRWQKNLRDDFGGKPGTWAYSESPLVDGNTLVCTPGGNDATLIALNKNTGELLWKCPLSGANEAAYASAIAVEIGGVKQYVQMISGGLVGVEAKTGKVLWRYEKTISKFKANIPSPVARGELIFSAGSGTGAAAVKLTVSGGTVQAHEEYFGPKLPTAIGGAIIVGDYLYGTSGPGLMCLEFATGQVKWENPSVGAASLCYADGHLILHGENGAVALVEASPEGYREKGRFNPPDRPARTQAMEKSWAYPALANGRLFLRDHNLLWCYDVKSAPGIN